MKKDENDHQLCTLEKYRNINNKLTFFKMLSFAFLPGNVYHVGV